MRDAIRPRRGQRIIRIVIPPELFRVIETDQVRILAEKFFIHREIEIGEMLEAAAGLLDRRPHAVLRTDSQPRLDGFITVFRHAELAVRHRMTDGHRKIHHHKRADVLRNQIYNLLGSA